jgi:hypothetical protein
VGEINMAGSAQRRFSRFAPLVAGVALLALAAAPATAAPATAAPGVRSATAPASGAAAWTRRSPATNPAARVAATMGYDRARGRLILFGGLGTQGALGDTWAWDGATWLQLSPSASPPARSGAVMAYDDTLGRLVLFGGQGIGAYLNDTWTWDGAAWDQLHPSASPPARTRAAMTATAVPGQLVLFGGVSASTVLGDTWTWNSATWSEQHPASRPPARSSATIGVAAGQVVLFGGVAPTAALGDTWTWDGTAWTQRQPANSPIPRFGASMAFDARGGQLVLYGGMTLDLMLGADYSTWTWDGTTWSEPVQPGNAGGRYDASMAYDGGTGQLVLFGGYENGSAVAETAVWGVASMDATFTYPYDGEAGVDATTAFSWSPIATAQGYAMAVGTTPFGTDLAQSAVLPATQTSYRVKALPTGRTLYATVLTELSGVWGYHNVTFTAAPGDAFTYPTDGQVNVDASQPFTWSSIPASQGAIMVVGTRKFGTDLGNTGLMPASQTSVNVPSFLSGPLYATLITKTNGGYSRYQEISFTARQPAAASVTLVNSFPDTVRITVGGHSYDLVSGQQFGPVAVVPAANGNDVLSVAIVAQPTCGMGDAGHYFDPAKSYRLTITATLGACLNYPHGPEFTVTAA